MTFDINFLKSPLSIIDTVRPHETIIADFNGVDVQCVYENETAIDSASLRRVKIKTPKCVKTCLATRQHPFMYRSSSSFFISKTDIPQ